MYDAGVNVNHVDDVELIDDVVIDDENFFDIADSSNASHLPLSIGP